jgi:hypothetical protein
MSDGAWALVNVAVATVFPAAQAVVLVWHCRVSKRTLDDLIEAETRRSKTSLTAS